MCFKFAYDADSDKYGYKVTDSEGADTFYPFIDTSNATATADMITEGYSAYVNGVLIEGTRPAPTTYQSGYYTTSYLAYGASATYSITFPKKFKDTPVVTVSSDNSNIRMSVSGTPTTTGFILYCINQGNGSKYQAGCNWKATGYVID